MCIFHTVERILKLHTYKTCNLKKCTSFQDLKEKQLLQNLNFAALSIHQQMFIQNNDLECALIP